MVTLIIIQVFVEFKKVFESLLLRKFKYGAPDTIRTCDRWYRNSIRIST